MKKQKKIQNPVGPSCSLPLNANFRHPFSACTVLYHEKRPINKSLILFDLNGYQAYLIGLIHFQECVFLKMMVRFREKCRATGLQIKKQARSSAKKFRI